MKKVAILQSNYIPWKGYFDMIAAVDEFILYDDMQYTKNDWRNRNQIKTPQGVQWLTVPVRSKGRFGQTIRETEIEGASGQETIGRPFRQNYRRARMLQRDCGMARTALSGRATNASFATESSLH